MGDRQGLDEDTLQALCRDKNKKHPPHPYQGREAGKTHFVMKESTKAKSQRILDALLQGMVLTPKDANDIGDTTDGTRFIRFLREKYPIKDEKVEGELYHRYWMDREYLDSLKEIGRQVSEGTFFDNLLAV